MGYSGVYSSMRLLDLLASTINLCIFPTSARSCVERVGWSNGETRGIISDGVIAGSPTLHSRPRVITCLPACRFDPVSRKVGPWVVILGITTDLSYLSSSSRAVYCCPSPLEDASF